MTKTKVLPVLLGLVTLNLLNLFDAYFTYIGVAQGYLEELNPIMDYLLDAGPFFFFRNAAVILGITTSSLRYLDRAGACKPNSLSRSAKWPAAAFWVSQQSPA